MDAIKNALESAEKARKSLVDLINLPADKRPESYREDLKSARENVILFTEEFEAYKAADLLGGMVNEAKNTPVNRIEIPGQAPAQKGGKQDFDFKSVMQAMKTASEKDAFELPFNGLTLGKKAITRVDSAIANGYEDLAELEITPARLVDFLPRRPSNGTAVTYRMQTVLLDAAAAKAEGNTLPQASFTAKPVTLPFSVIGHYFDVTMEELDDDAAFRNLMNVQAPQGVYTQFDVDVLTGSGTAPTMLGILNVAANSLFTGSPAIQTQAKSSDSRALAIKKAMTKVRVTGKANPGIISIHPNDWDEIIGDLLSGTTNAIINYQAGVNPRLWGLPVVENENHTEGTALVLDPAFWPLVIKSGLVVQGTNSDGVKFQQNIETFRAFMRAVMQIRRPQSACTVTGI